jgi:GT2 family glycosyltransferase
MNISIVIPNHNGEKLLAKNLPFVIEAVGDAEIIVVDDASDDNSVKTIQKRFPGIKIIRKKNNEGFASTVNTGVIQSAGELIVLLNTDVIPHKGFLTEALPHFKNKNVFAVGFS